jgi:F-type H+-transporting ATPase subunit b
MLIDWFTFFAQVLNFLVLVWLLKRFLYKPILNAIDEREKKIAARMGEAEAAEAQAREERAEFSRKSAELDRQRDDLLGKAREEADAERRRLVEEAHREADALAAKRRKGFKKEQQDLSLEIIRRTGEEVFAIARKALRDLASASLEERMCEAFLLRLRGLSDEEKGLLASALSNSPRPVRVRSAFELPPEQRSAVEKAVREILATEAPVRFETSPDLIGGIELSTDGHKVAWSVEEYLASMEKSLGEVFSPENLEPASPATIPEEGGNESPAR